jgi:hypothetical protein
MTLSKFFAEFEKGYKENYHLLRKNKDYRDRRLWYKGIVTPISWDEQDRPVGYSLLMDNDEELVLIPLHKNAKIAKYMNKKVYIFGEKIDRETLGFYDVELVKKKKWMKIFKKKHRENIHEYEVMIPQTLKMDLMH